MGILQNKRALIVGVASTRSIAYGIAKAMKQQGAELAFTYQTEKLQKPCRRSCAMNFPLKLFYLAMLQAIMKYASLFKAAY